MSSPVNSLSDLKAKLDKIGVQILLFDGIRLETPLGVYTLGPSEDYTKTVLYLGKDVVTKKDFNAYLKQHGGSPIDD